MALQIFLGRFSIGNSRKDFEIDSTACAIATGDYYLYGYTGEGTNQLLEALDAEAEAEVAGKDFTFTYSTSTGKVTIAADDTFTLDWTDTALGTLLGYSSASYSGSDSYTAENPPRYVWAPTRAATGYPLNLGYIYSPSSTTRVYRSADGTTTTVPGASLLYDAVIEYMHLPEADVISPSTGATYKHLQEFWKDVAHSGEPIRVYPDKTANTSTGDFVTALWGSPGEETIGSFLDYASRHLRAYNGLWDVSIPLTKHVT